MKSPNFERKKLTHSISACHYHGTDQVSNKLGAKKGNVAQNTTLNLLKRWINSTFDKQKTGSKFAKIQQPVRFGPWLSKFLK